MCLLDEHCMKTNLQQDQVGYQRAATLRIAIVVSPLSISFTNPHILALKNPVSTCRVTRVVFLSEEANNDAHDDLISWGHRHGIDKSKVRMEIGRPGLTNILEDDQIEGMYFAGAILSRSQLVKSALRSKKHVLVDDSISQSVEEFAHLLSIANRHKCHLQDTTMFVHHYAVQQFLGCVLDDTFGIIQKIDATFDINPQSDHFFNTFKATAEDSTGCIDNLCRYCALLGAVVFMKDGKRPVSARVTQQLRQQKNGLPLHAVCQISFEEGCTLIIDCSYVNYQKSRQTFDVHSSNHTATLSNFVFHNDGLSCYQLYENDEKTSSSGKKVVKSGESIDVVSGPVQEIVFWRRFAEFSYDAATTSKHQQKTTVDPELRRWRRINTINRSELAYAAIQSQNIAVGLMESFHNKGVEVMLPVINFS